ncbi:Arc domain-containing protein [Parasedimentitalea maritima]|uniref:Arc domain-containing protein n=1 Tax=Parasedimentitalea maritima TaxID=2578117 RepID=A0A6A4RBR7_9RHOB|nr:Arc domain-containing protein [Zongyanglinia marina]
MKTTQFKLNLPEDVKAWLEEEAVRNLRSQGAQVVSCLRATMSRQQTLRERAEK